MTIDEKIEVRRMARIGKNFILSDSLRKELEGELIFINDLPNDAQEIYYLTEKYFKHMYKIKENHALVSQQIIELQSVKSTDETQKQLLSLQSIKTFLEKSKALKITNKREYFDYRQREDIQAEGYFQSWLFRTNEQLKKVSSTKHN